MDTEELLQMVKNLRELNQRNRENSQMQMQKKQRCFYKCSLCKDTGWLERKRKDGSKYFVSCRCREEEKIKNQWKSAGLNIELSDLTFNNFKEWNSSASELKKTAISYFNDFEKIKKSRSNSILMCGQAGSGKTHISIALAINLIKSGITVVYMPYRESMTRLKQKILTEEGYRKIISKFQISPVLLIDDLYKGRISKADLNVIFEIVNYRYLNHLPIIVSSELTVDEIISFDEAIGSRIYEMCRDYMITIEKGINRNYRFKKGAEILHP